MSYWRNKYKQDVVIAILIVILPFLAYSHLLFSDNNSVLVFFDYHFEHRFKTNEAFVWGILSNFLPLLLLLLMFFTTNQSWRYFLMPLLALYLLALLDMLVNTNSSYSNIISIEGISIITVFSILVIFIDRLIFKSYRNKLFGLKLKYLLFRKTNLDHTQVNDKITAIRSEKTNLSIMHYLKKIYYLETLIRNTLKINPDPSIKANNGCKKSIDLVIVIILISMTALWFIDSQIPKGSMEMDFFGLKITNNGFNDVHIFIWIVSRKFIVIVFLSLWFITCKYWWKYAIMSPLLLFMYQFWEAFQNVQSIDAFGNLRVFPLVLLSVLLVMIASRLVKYQASLLEFYESINKEIDQIIEELKYEKIIESQRRYKNIKDQLKGNSSEEILPRLIEIQDKLIRNLESES